MIKLTKEQIEKLYNGEKIDKFEGWYVDYDRDTGDFDSEKGAMYDFEIYLYDSDDNLVGTAIGGYYTGNTGVCFNYDLEFEAPEPETPLSKFNEFLVNIAQSGGDLKDKIKRINKEIKRLEND